MSKFFFTLYLFISIVWMATCLPATLFGDEPFSVIWNADSEYCRQYFGIEFNFSAYNIVDNTDDSFSGNKMTIFYKDELGNYPRVLRNGTKVNGGIPQMSPLQDHLDAASVDINYRIPNDTFPGLAVIDWESWRPLFVHNFDSKKVYQILSEELVKQTHPNCNKHCIKVKARNSFNNAAKLFMKSTLLKASNLRPLGRWGFYGFPRCYKHHCIKVRPDNNRLGWMFSSSTGLYPSLYLKHQEDSWIKKVRFVHDTLRETFRVFRRFSSANKTVIVPYTRFRYVDPEQFYFESELLITLAMSAIKGSAGAVLWDSSENFREEYLCRDMERYLVQTLGPFVRTLTSFLKNCSREQCSGQGRCIEKRVAVLNSDISSHLLHAFGQLVRVSRHFLQRQYSWLYPWHNLTPHNRTVAEILQNYDYTCQCYPGWSGNSCNVPSET